MSCLCGCTYIYLPDDHNYVIQKSINNYGPKFQERLLEYAPDCPEDRLLRLNCIVPNCPSGHLAKSREDRKKVRKEIISNGFG